MNKTENLNVIGGFQDSKNYLNLLFYKLDKKPATPADLIVESYRPQAQASIDQVHDNVEQLVNSIHLDSNGILRCAITLGSQANRVHLFVFE